MTTMGMFGTRSPFEALDRKGQARVRTREIRPEQAGWVRVDGRTWLCPDGSLYVFSPYVPQLLIETC